MILTACWFGYRARGGAAGVGRVVTQGVVVNILLLFVVDLIITDVIMADTPIMSLTCTLRQLYPKVPIILISGLPAEPLIHNSLTLGANEFIPKPIHMGKLYSTIERLVPAA
mgnify:CR=1 FL=1